MIKESNINNVEYVFLTNEKIYKIYTHGVTYINTNSIIYKKGTNDIK